MEAPLPASVPAPEDRPQYETNSVNNYNDSDVKAEQEAEVEVGSCGEEVAKEEGGDYTAGASATPTQSPRNRPNEATRADDGDENGKDEDEEDEAGAEAVEEEVREEKRKSSAEETAELLWACETRDKAAVFELTRRGVRADAQDPLDARTPLHAAVTAGSADLLILLLSSCPEIDVNKQNRGGATPLHDAVQFASEDIVDILLTSAPGLDVNVGDKMGATPLILAAHRGREEIVARLIHHEANVNAYTVIGTTGLPLTSPTSSLFLVWFPQRNT
ncbi:ankyrin repeat containing protein [Acanthamoeba castellanii str. Neff]|uniref:Ankyrin repeat containing protein n=1 Tax=Acanthamoeba castellanii (strain ATCC 30010 / Neff) TaxID=1257118 RepID=L8H5W9_ACACF|nr:ankyrin repeat containing protein [Acanthamoeba castellanii str. Neff]ELR19886.1 ankyrin repeat containing protein [Acanthamoeba castellanii str. Neff]